MLSVLENLTDNAFKYGGSHPQVLLRAGKTDGRFSLVVEDKGIGFSPKIAHELFEPFRRAIEAKGVVQHGTGLGLSIAYKLADKMGGALTAFSEGPDKGSRFTLLLKGSK